ncbi:MAG: hypothetical protein KF865_15220 [Bdellovibrionaceae bacterium]|nr:hypothetical protein [Pseudobdellovibrionaceae bacterium]
MISIPPPNPLNILRCFSHFGQKILAEFDQPLVVEILLLEEIEEFRLLSRTFHQFIFEIQSGFAPRFPGGFVLRDDHRGRDDQSGHENGGENDAAHA